MQALGQVLEVFLGVRLEARHRTLLGEVNDPALMLDGKALRVYPNVGVNGAEQLLQWLDSLGRHGLQLGSLLLANHREVLGILGPRLLARTAAHENLHPLEYDELLKVDFIVHHKRTKRLLGCLLSHRRAGEQENRGEEEASDEVHGADWKVLHEGRAAEGANQLEMLG